MQPPALVVPVGISRALARVGARLNAWVALDAALAGALTGAAVGAAASAARSPLPWAVAAGATAALLVAAGEARSRWVGPFAAAATLDRMLGAKDRFVSALHFVAATDRSPLYALQLSEAAAFLDRAGAPPSPARPRLRAPRYAVVAAFVALAGLGLPVAHDTLARWVGHRRASELLQRGERVLSTARTKGNFAY